MMRSRSPASRRRASGFSMIEVLIALVVLALGLLGFALLQTMNLRFTQSANYRTQATNLAYDLLDQMRANRLSAAQYEAASFAAGSVDASDGCEREVGTLVVADHVLRWKCQVTLALGTEASATVDYSEPSGVATVTITWGESRIGEGESTSFEVETQL